MFRVEDSVEGSGFGIPGQLGIVPVSSVEIAEASLEDPGAHCHPV